MRPPEKTSTVPSSLAPEVGPVGRRWLGQLLDLVAQVGDVLLGRLEGEGELLVLGHGLGQLALGLEELLLEGLHPARALLEPPAEDGDLLFGGQRPCPERLEILFVRRPSLAVGIVEINRRNHLIRAVGTPVRTLHRADSGTDDAGAPRGAVRPGPASSSDGGLSMRWLQRIAWREQRARNPWLGCAGNDPSAAGNPSDPGRHAFEPRDM